MKKSIHSILQSLHCILCCFLSCHIEKGAFLDVICCFDIYCAIDVRMSEHPQYCLHYVLHFLVWEPFLLPQHFLTHETIFDVGVVNGSSKLHLGKFERELFREVDIDDELESLVWAANGSIKKEFPVEEILLDGGYDASWWWNGYCYFISIWTLLYYFSNLFMLFGIDILKLSPWPFS